MKINEIHQRAQKLNDKEFKKDGPVVYWMSRDQRVHHNWALLYAKEMAKSINQSLLVVFTLVPSYPLGAVWRHYHFMLEGLKEIETTLNQKNIPFKLLCGDPATVLPEFISSNKISALITDFDPLKIKQFWRRELIPTLSIPFWEVDAHNIVPCWQASSKLEFAAYTIRPKINKLLHTYLTAYPEFVHLPANGINFKNDWDEIYNAIQVDKDVAPVTWIEPGEKAAQKAFTLFLQNKLEFYGKNRNDPTKQGVSDLSPYLHFGHISAQQIAMEVLKLNCYEESSKAFLEELIIRKELSDNFCYYNKNYDNILGAHDWAKKTIAIHRHDEREYLYTFSEFENALTHDQLWNAAQLQMVNTGKMHGYMRMYWAKKILEWTASPEEALETAIFLNDKYSLDGRDPNGYVGCMWSIAGVHDRAWTERPVFGKIRYMNDKGCRRKFDVKRYISRIYNL